MFPTSVDGNSLFFLPFKGTCEVIVTQSCLTLCNHMDCCLPVSPVHGILQARILEWVAISFSNIKLPPTILHMIMYMFQCYFLRSSHSLLPLSPNVFLLSVKSALAPTSMEELDPFFLSLITALREN